MRIDFDKLGAAFNKIGFSKEDLAFMSEEDAAIHRKGHAAAYLLTLTICLMVGAFLIWAKFAVLDEVTRGMGQAIPSQQIQVIQNLEGGILEAILVGENQIVEKGDVLVRIDNTLADSQFKDAYAKSMEHEAAIARLNAQAHGGEPVFPEALTAQDPQVIEDQRTIFNAQKRQLDLELKILQSEYDRKMQEIEEIKAKQQELAKSLQLATEQKNIAKPLMEKGLYSRVDYIKLEREVVTLQGDINAFKLSLPRINKEASETQEKIARRQAEFHSAALEEISKRRGELNSLKQAMAAGEDRVTRTEVRSKVRGTVKQIVINTIGGVVKPGEPIMEIVPLDDTLLFEVQIRPSDIAFLYPGQKAMIKITAYDFSIYGGMEGVVEQISADTIQDDKGEHFYKVKLRTKTNALMHRGSQLPIIPGMTASVDIMTGKKSVLDYLLKPILKASQNALRER
ncbi:MAG: HlyD family type I secretion periplasmic adaptor subunit [Desulfobacterales bacterium]|nr:HlyD family type I secretion periplasmic adaptor subunit [Desulfobacterales bacterium]